MFKHFDFAQSRVSDEAITPDVLGQINWTMVLAIPWYWGRVLPGSILKSSEINFHFPSGCVLWSKSGAWFAILAGPSVVPIGANTGNITTLGNDAKRNYKK